MSDMMLWREGPPPPARPPAPFFSPPPPPMKNDEEPVARPTDAFVCSSSDASLFRFLSSQQGGFDFVCPSPQPHRTLFYLRYHNYIAQ